MLLFPSFASGQTQGKVVQAAVSAKVLRLANQIEGVNQLMDEAVYEAGIKPEQYEYFEQLMAIGTEKEIVVLTDHPNAVVRCYAFWALAKKKSPFTVPVLKKHLKDEAQVKTQFGCLGGIQTVAEFMFEVVTPKYVDVTCLKLNAEELQQLKQKMNEE